LDIFSGSGSTAVACANAGRQFFGCELDSSYYEKSLLRIQELTGIKKI
jgi:site-specific DNA-methyltransferase (adenine-specific)